MYTPFISIIMPTYRRVNMLPRAINSVRMSTFTNWEFIIVDDASPDTEFAEKLTYIKSLHDDRIVLSRRSINGGCSAARNTGLSLARGQWIAYMDDDDEMTSNWLMEVAGLASTNMYDVVLGDVKYDDDDFRHVHPPVINVLRNNKVYTVSFAHAAAVCKQHGGWNENFKRHADDEIIFRYVRSVGHDRTAVTPIVASFAHTSHERISNTISSLKYIRLVHYANPNVWWASTNNAVVICINDDVEQAVLMSDYHMGEFIDFTTCVQPDWWTLIPDIFRTASPAMAVITSTEQNVWTKLLCQLSRGCAYLEIPGGMATRVDSGEGIAMVLRAAKQARTEKTAIS